jgi:hypothetical protein
MHLPRGRLVPRAAAGILFLLLVATTIPADASAQVVGARRMSMGGVILSNGGEREAQNVAYRAVPRNGQPTSLPIPLGIVQYAMNPPVFDPNNPDFNALQLANDLLNPPWHLQLYEPSAPSSDVLIEISRTSLVVNLDDVKRAFPQESMENGGVLRFPGIYLGVGPVFAGVSSYSQVGHTLTLDPGLHAALAEAEPFVTDTRYQAVDEGVAQALMAFTGGVAAPLIRIQGDDPYDSDGVGLYAGTRLKYLRGIGYLEAHNVAGFTTRDTLFGGDPVDVDFEGVARYTSGDNIFSGSGYGLDLGAVLFVRRFEFGFGVNDLVHEVTWTGDIDTIRFNAATNDLETVPGPENVKFDGSFPVTWNASAAYRPGSWVLAATVLKNVGDTTVHLGAERWFGWWALRGGTYMDTQWNPQYAGGAGVRMGPVGLDMGVQTHSRTITGERGVEMAFSLALYGGGS